MEDAQHEFPPEENAADCAMTQPDTDSGYGGSSSASLELHDGHLDPEASSTISSDCSPPQPSSDTGTIRPQPQTIRIRPISKPIERETAMRASDVIEQMSLLLREHMLKSKRSRYLSRPKRNLPSMSIRLIMLGTTEEDAKPCLVIFCTDSHGSHDKIRDFLRKSFVKELYQPQEGTKPSFDVHIIGASPSTQSGAVVGIPFDEGRSEPSPCTFCGTPIYFIPENGEQRRFATMGGILQLKFPGGTEKLYGLTAEHGGIYPEDSDDSEISMSDGGSDCDDSSSRPGSCGDYPPTTVVQIDLDTGSCLDIPTRDDQPTRPDVHNIEPVMTQVEISASGNTHNGAYRDWALFPFPINNLKPKPNMLQAQGQQPKPLEIPTALTDISESRSVLIITGSSGLKNATLAPCLSRVLLKPGTAFVKAFTVELSTTSDIRLGDSGSWVVDPLTLGVYGHLVATDVLMGAYVIPLVDIIKDIKTRISEVSIQFPLEPLLHPKQFMGSSLTSDSVVPPLINHPVVSSTDGQSNSAARASTIVRTEPLASVFPQPISTTTASSMNAEVDSSDKMRARTGVSPHLNWVPDFSVLAVRGPRILLPGDFLSLDQLLVRQRFCGPGTDQHNRRLCLCQVKDEVSTDDWVMASGPTPLAKEILTLAATLKPLSDFSLVDSFGNTTLHLIAARDETKQGLMRAITWAPWSSITATNAADQTILHVLGIFWFETVASNADMLTTLLKQLSRRGYDFSARDIYGRNFFHILRSKVPHRNIMGRFFEAFGQGIPPCRDAFGVIAPDQDVHFELSDKQSEQQLQGSPVVTHAQLMKRVEAAISNPSLDDSYDRNGLHFLADVALSADALLDDNGRAFGDKGSSKLSHSNRGPRTASSLQNASLCKTLMDQLLASGVSPDHYDGDGNTVLMTFAARLPDEGDYSLSFQIMNTLLEAGAVVNARNRARETALHIAVRAGHQLVTRALLKQGANVHARDGEGRSVLDVADMMVLQSKNVKDRAHAEAIRAWLSGRGQAVQNPTVKQEWGWSNR